MKWFRHKKMYFSTYMAHFQLVIRTLLALIVTWFVINRPLIGWKLLEQTVRSISTWNRPVGRYKIQEGETCNMCFPGEDRINWSLKLWGPIGPPPLLPGSDGPKYDEGAFSRKKRVRGRKWARGRGADNPLDQSTWKRAIITGRFLAAAAATAAADVVSAWK